MSKVHAKEFNKVSGGTQEPNGLVSKEQVEEMLGSPLNIAPRAFQPTLLRGDKSELTTATYSRQHGIEYVVNGIYTAIIDMQISSKGDLNGNDYVTIGGMSYAQTSNLIAAGSVGYMYGTLSPTNITNIGCYSSSNTIPHVFLTGMDSAGGSLEVGKFRASKISNGFRIGLVISYPVNGVSL